MTLPTLGRLEWDYLQYTSPGRDERARRESRMGARLVALIRNPQEVSSSSPRTIHFEGLPAGLLEDQEEPRALPSPDVLVIEETSDGVFLYRYDREGGFGGDTWHESIEEAKEQAGFEYGDLVEEWKEVPEGTDAIDHGIALASGRLAG